MCFNTIINGLLILQCPRDGEVFPYCWDILVRLGWLVISVAYLVILDGSFFCQCIKLILSDDSLKYMYFCTHPYYFFCTLCVGTNLVAYECWFSVIVVGDLSFRESEVLIVDLCGAKFFSIIVLCFLHILDIFIAFLVCFWWFEVFVVTTSPGDDDKFCSSFILTI